jgi:hypothetical protein
MEMPLLNLKRNGLINDFFVADSYETDIPNDALFNVLWLQRVNNMHLIRHLSNIVNDQFLFDLDDLLIAPRSYGDDSYLDYRVPVIQALNDCQVLTVTSRRLCSLLERHTQLHLAPKARVCPNGFEFSRLLRTPQMPAGILWASSDVAALTTSREPVVQAIARFARDVNLPIYCSGTLDDDIKSTFWKTIDLGMLSYWHHKAVFASLPAMIGVAPLETQADQDTLDFVNGKSDVKMVEFGGLGHPGVYSQAPPYADTDLHTGVLVPNTESAWLDGLDAVYRQGWQRAAQEQEHIIQLRHMDRLSRENWLPALEAVVLKHPVSGRDVKQWRRTKLAHQLITEVLHPHFLRKVKGKLPTSVTKWAKKIIKGGS